MLNHLKFHIKRIPALYSFLLGVHVLFLGFKEATNCGMWGSILGGYFGRRRLVVIYCYSPSHFQNLPQLPSMLLDGSEKFDVLVLCNFTKDQYCIKNKSPFVRVKYRINPLACRMLNAVLFITPAVGMPDYSMPKKSIKIHFMVSLTSLDGVYLESHFDSYDYIYCAGEHQVQDFIRLSQKRAWTKKALIRGGYPKLDHQLERKSASAHTTLGGLGSIIYAPTHVYEVNEALASLREYGAEIVEQLIRSGRKVIFRPHPVSFEDVDAPAVRSICDTHRNDSQFVLDQSRDYFNTYSESSVMVTDLSGTGFTYAFAFERPVIFFAHNQTGENGLSGIQFENRQDIGEVVRSPSELAEAIDRIFASYDSYVEKIIKFRERTIFNLGTSEQYFIDNLNCILRNERHDDWVYL